MSQDTPHPTPSLTHLTPSHYREVYEPAEDSFLLMDALEKDSKTLRQLRHVCEDLICLLVCTFASSIHMAHFHGHILIFLPFIILLQVCSLHQHDCDLCAITSLLVYILYQYHYNMQTIDMC